MRQVEKIAFDRPGLTPRQESVAVLLAAGASVVAAARRSHAAVPTIRKWLGTQPAFRQRIAQLRAELTSRAVGLLIDGMAEAARTLRRLLKSESEVMRHRAAESLLTHGAQLSALAELQDRIANLEQNQSGRRR
jgi:hypothetical protein